MSVLAFALSSGPFDSPFIVPVAGCAMIACIVIASIASSNRQRELRSQERLAAIAKGITPPPTEEELALMHGKPSTDSTRRLANTRRAGIILVASAVGLALFFFLLTIILRQREILSGVACSLIPLGIGVGFLIDARIQARELAESASNTKSIQQ